MKNRIISGFYILLITFFYISLNLYIQNFDLINTTLLGSYPIAYKYKILTTIYSELLFLLPLYSYIILFITALLTAFNLVLLYKRVSLLRSNGKLKIMVGGTSLLGLAVSGCASCGLPLLAFLGVSASLSFLPFQGRELSIITILLLIVSTIYIYKSSKSPLKCKLPMRKKK